MRDGTGRETAKVTFVASPVKEINEYVTKFQPAMTLNRIQCI